MRENFDFITLNILIYEDSYFLLFNTNDFKKVGVGSVENNVIVESNSNKKNQSPNIKHEIRI